MHVQHFQGTAAFSAGRGPQVPWRGPRRRSSQQLLSGGAVLKKPKARRTPPPPLTAAGCTSRSGARGRARHTRLCRGGDGRASGSASGTSPLRAAGRAPGSRETRPGLAWRARGGRDPLGRELLRGVQVHERAHVPACEMRAPGSRRAGFASPLTSKLPRVPDAGALLAPGECIDLVGRESRGREDDSSDGLPSHLPPAGAAPLKPDRNTEAQVKALSVYCGPGGGDPAGIPTPAPAPQVLSPESPGHREPRCPAAVLPCCSFATRFHAGDRFLVTASRSAPGATRPGHHLLRGAPPPRGRGSGLRGCE